MRLKSYFVHTMEEALQTAKVELGDDAMLVDSKRLETPPGGKARLEVIFAAPIAPHPKAVVAAAAAAAPAPMAVSAPVGSIAGMQRFRGELTCLLDALNRKPDASRLEPLTPAGAQMDALRARLLLSEVPAAAVDEIVSQCRPLIEGLVLRNAAGEKDVERAVLPLLAAEWPHALEDDGDRRIHAFIGPTGAGKTSMIAKLAFRIGVAQGQPVRVFSVDNLRIGASDQLAHICSLLGIPFQSLDYCGALPMAVSTAGGKGAILIDTPGYGPGDLDLLEETADYVRRVEGAACHLVLPATLRYSEMQKRGRHFAPFSPTRLVFTRLDETEFFGPAWAYARDSRIAVDWVSTGPAVPEDIEAADASQFAAAALGSAAFRSGAERAVKTNTLVSAATAGASRI